MEASGQRVDLPPSEVTFSVGFLDGPVPSSMVEHLLCKQEVLGPVLGISIQRYQCCPRLPSAKELLLV